MSFTDFIFDYQAVLTQSHPKPPTLSPVVRFPVIQALCLSSCLVTAVFRITTMRVLSAKSNSGAKKIQLSQTWWEWLSQWPFKFLNTLKPLNILNLAPPILPGHLSASAFWSSNACSSLEQKWQPKTGKICSRPALFDEPPRDAQFAGQQSAHVPHGSNSHGNWWSSNTFCLFCVSIITRLQIQMWMQLPFW